MPPLTATLKVRLEPAALEELEQRAEKVGAKPSQIVRRLIRGYLAGEFVPANGAPDGG